VIAIDRKSKKSKVTVTWKIFVANFIRFLAVQKFENQLKFDKVTES